MAVHPAGDDSAGPLYQLFVALVCSGHMEASRSTPIIDRVKDWRGLATAQDAILCHGMPVQQVGSGESSTLKQRSNLSSEDGLEILENPGDSLFGVRRLVAAF